MNSQQKNQHIECENKYEFKKRKKNPLAICYTHNFKRLLSAIDISIYEHYLKIKKYRKIPINFER